MTAVIQNCLYIMTQGAYLRRDHAVLQVEVEKQKRFETPMHLVESVAVFGNVMVSPGALGGCAEAGIPVSFFTESGRLQARVDAPGSGNVLLRRAQFRKADDPEVSCAVARRIVEGKILNARVFLQRGRRETGEADDTRLLGEALEDLGVSHQGLLKAGSVDAVRGHEGDAARIYFSVFSSLLRQSRDDFRFEKRTRRPPRDRINALLSFLYALLLHDCAAACAGAGLDPSVGFLHEDRPGRPSLALDLMEEFRPLLADRLAVALVNLGQVTAEGFAIREGGGVEMSEGTRRTVVQAWQKRKNEEVTHPLLDQKMRIGMLMFVQARMLARFIRGDVPQYMPCVMK